MGAVLEKSSAALFFFCAACWSARQDGVLFGKTKGGTCVNSGPCFEALRCTEEQTACTQMQEEARWVPLGVMKTWL
jgi:hypothetical protein